MSSQITPERVMEALKEVKVPGTKVDVLSIKLIGEIKMTGTAEADVAREFNPAATKRRLMK